MGLASRGHPTTRGIRIALCLMRVALHLLDRAGASLPAIYLSHAIEVASATPTPRTSGRWMRRWQNCPQRASASHVIDGRTPTFAWTRASSSIRCAVACGGRNLRWQGVRSPEDFDWSLCGTFLALARRGSIAAAAHELGLSHQTTRRRLDALEKTVGAVLFTRSQNGMRLTPEGQRLVAGAERVEAAAGTMLRSAGWRAGGGTVGIAADRLLGSELVPILLASLGRENPGLRYELTLGDDLDEVLSRPADVALVTERPQRDGMVATRAATLPEGLFASPCWKDGAGRNAGGMLTTGDRVAALAGAVAGLGPATLPLCIATRRGGLVRIEADQSELAVWIVFHPDLRNVPQVRLVVEALRRGMAAFALER